VPHLRLNKLELMRFWVMPGSSTLMRSGILFCSISNKAYASGLPNLGGIMRTAAGVCFSFKWLNQQAVSMNKKGRRRVPGPVT
jgi:hypothetical protein